ncbi:SusD/RagB family nutrient-binding outer membrane lipoprotein [Pedobacter nototheniae]|uniref:SusD/RagB family nutrient-binding outer membrane lipoprotein n=1 Tax=Pedobacter nototheniae TaxID=2488994 RepID=UPI00293169BA|nr:SusD/RagB family nutrient-binding outer membrane lipoprotein [Pedobacter nototheniae]
MKKIYSLLILSLLISACAKNKGDYNIDVKQPSVVPAATLFSAALKSYADVLTSPSVNVNVFRFYVQQWTTTEYLDEPRYNLLARPIPQAFWQAVYRDVLMDLKESKKILNADPLLAAGIKTNQTAQIEIMEVMAWSSLVNTFGNVPYTDALDINNVQPKYDDAKTIYNDLLVRLDAALAKLNPSFTGFESADLLYKEGGVSKWLKFGNSLKLRLGLILADLDAAKAKTIVEAAAANVFTSNDDNARFRYLNSTPNNNPVSEAINPARTQRKDYLGSRAFIDKLNALNDPRRSAFFTTVNGSYIGGFYGFSNSSANYSNISSKISALDFEALLLDYTEVEFALAEASARGFNVNGSPAEHYNKAVRASILYWGASDADATTYLARPDVAYATAGSNYKEVIGIQKWIAFNNRGYDAWVEWKRLGFPVLIPPSPDNAPPGQSAPAGLQIPVRLIYPLNEQTLNGANRSAAAAAIGGDVVTTKIFWDVN